jgi:hypothetical protein
VDETVFTAMDENGNEFEIHHILQRSMVFDRNTGKPVGTMDDRLETADGQPVNHIAQGVYEIIVDAH